MLGRSRPLKKKFGFYLVLRLRRLLGLELLPGGAASPDRGLAKAAVGIETELQQRRCGKGAV